jgi:cellobionic acid phosphorylase
LLRGDARYETPVCVLQYSVDLVPGETRCLRFLFGAARDEAEIAGLRGRYFTGAGQPDGFAQAASDYRSYLAEGKGCLTIQTPDPALDNFVNHWLPRQMFYHGSTNRLTTDPQTRNYLQDNLGMSYLQPEVARQAFVRAASQQRANGAMPDGIILHPEAELKYINQVPHTDHCLWMPLCVAPYLDETDDYSLLDVVIPFADSGESATLFEHVCRGLDWLASDRDARGLNFINQGDWCDPMNMVGYQGKGVSGWLTIATAYGFQVWADVCDRAGRPEAAARYRALAQKTNETANRHLWDGDWYARGITDNNVVFGVRGDTEGRIFLNPQGWALLGGTADAAQKAKLIRAVTEQLESPYGVEKLGPPYTRMREDVGRVTQKFPGSAENGAVYNHAAAFYIYGLYAVGEADDAYRLLRKMLPGPSEADIIQRGQLPVFLPNYYRGAYRQIPRTAGRSSHLFNTGTAPWFFRCVLDGLFGVCGTREGLRVAPQLPARWPGASLKRTFRGSTFVIQMRREAGVQAAEVIVDGAVQAGGVVRSVVAGREYAVTVRLPLSP